MEHGEIKTVQTHPDHETVGHLFKAPFYEKSFLCDSYEHPLGFWMTKVSDQSDRRNVSPIAINRTFHHDWKSCQHEMCKPKSRK